jgi:hypothetical protein
MKTYIITIAAAAVLASSSAYAKYLTKGQICEERALKEKYPVAMRHTEKGAGLDPDPMSLYPLGVQATLIKLIEVAIVKDVYESVPGGFPQFAYRSCLKGKPLDE